MHASLALATRILAMASALGALLLPATGKAAPDEIVVFTDELEKKGEIGYELHLNYAARARKTPDYPGEQPPHRVLRVMPEVVWGFAEKWNLGVHVPMSYDFKNRATTVDGLKIRLHNLHVVEHGADSSTYFGANYEYTLYSNRITESRHNGEVRGILGHKRGDWKFTINPILKQALSKNPDGRRVELDVFGQIMREFGEDFALGVEHYSSFGRVSRPVFGSQAEQITYLVVDIKTKKHYEIHLGVGHGWTAPTDKRVFKALIGFPF